jgi:uncharacterized protein YkwD
MLRLVLGWIWGLCLVGIAHGDPLTDVQRLRESGCGRIVPAPSHLRHVDRLDLAALRWAAGRALVAAAEDTGYAVDKVAGVHVAASDPAILQSLRRTSCSTLTRQDVTDVGVYRRGRDVWIVLASSYFVPSAALSATYSARVLELVNEIRARGVSCGTHTYGPAPPVRSSASLEHVAYGHALDMAQHNYFEHQDLTGATPADRVRAAGYLEKLVGENIAYGPRSPDEVVSGWLESPEHCENIMDRRFAEMGVGYALGRVPGRRSGLGLYWVQVLADPKL